MITQEVIKEIYKKYKKRPASPDELNMPPLFEAAHPSHDIRIDDEKLVINGMAPSSIFRAIPLKNIHAILEFESHIAVVLHSSIIFLSKADNGIFINFKPLEEGFWGKLKSKIKN